MLGAVSRERKLFFYPNAGRPDSLCWCVHLCNVQQRARRQLRELYDQNVWSGGKIQTKKQLRETGKFGVTLIMTSRLQKIDPVIAVEINNLVFLS